MLCMLCMSWALVTCCLCLSGVWECRRPAPSLCFSSRAQVTPLRGVDWLHVEITVSGLRCVIRGKIGHFRGRFRQLGAVDLHR